MRRRILVIEFPQAFHFSSNFFTGTCVANSIRFSATVDHRFPMRIRNKSTITSERTKSSSSKIGEIIFASHRTAYYAFQSVSLLLVSISLENWINTVIIVTYVHRTAKHTHFPVRRECSWSSKCWSNQVYVAFDGTKLTTKQHHLNENISSTSSVDCVPSTKSVAFFRCSSSVDRNKFNKNKRENKIKSKPKNEIRFRLFSLSSSFASLPLYSLAKIQSKNAVKQFSVGKNELKEKRWKRAEKIRKKNEFFVCSLCVCVCKSVLFLRI